VVLELSEELHQASGIRPESPGHEQHPIERKVHPLHEDVALVAGTLSPEELIQLLLVLEVVVRQALLGLADSLDYLRALQLVLFTLDLLIISILPLFLDLILAHNSAYCIS
jgi:hypothetical protein